MISSTKFLIVAAVALAMGCQAIIEDPLGAGADAAASADASSNADGSNADAASPDATPPPDALLCPPGPDQVQDPDTGHCFTIFRDLVPWPQAQANCAALGPTVHLATSASQAENDVFSALELALDIWIGANDITVENTFEWITGEPLIYTNWRDGEPNNSNNEDCAVIEGDNGGLWDDRRCAEQVYGYICERE